MNLKQGSIITLIGIIATIIIAAFSLNPLATRSDIATSEARSDAKYITREELNRSINELKLIFQHFADRFDTYLDRKGNK